MEYEELVESLGRLEREILEIREKAESPAIENCMREMYIHLFLAKQYAGIWDAICPEEMV